MQNPKLQYAKDLKLRWIGVSLHDVQKAITKARAQFAGDEYLWMAENLEILLIPKIYKRWRQLNQPPQQYGYGPEGPYALPVMETRIERVQNRLGPGYVVWVWGAPWNTMREEYYAHHPSVAWNGVSRQTVHRFVDELRWWGTNPEGFEDIQRRDPSTWRGIFEAFYNAGVYPQFGGKTHLKGPVK